MELDESTDLRQEATFSIDAYAPTPAIAIAQSKKSDTLKAQENSYLLVCQQFTGDMKKKATP